MSVRSTVAETDDHTAIVARRLLDVIRRDRDDPSIGFEASPQPLRGGFWAEIYSFRLRGAPPELDRDLVLRLMPDESTGRRETVVQRAVADQGFPAPKVRLSGGPDDGLERTFMIMDHVDGRPMLSGVSTGKLVLALPRLVRELETQLAGAAVRLHQLDADAVARAVETEVPDLPLGIDRMVDRLRAMADIHRDPFLTAAIERLRDTLPVPTRLCICHGDLHPLNVLVDDEHHATLVDWSSSQLADPAYELAFTRLVIAGAPLEVPKPLAGPFRRAARWLADRIVAAYRDQGAAHGLVLDDEQLDWHTGIHCMRALTDVAVWEALGEAEQHANHPFFVMRPWLESELARVTGVPRPR